MLFLGFNPKSDVISSNGWTRALFSAKNRITKVLVILRLGGFDKSLVCTYYRDFSFIIANDLTVFIVHLRPSYSGWEGMNVKRK